jgi:hypothetical protein
MYELVFNFRHTTTIHRTVKYKYSTFHFLV